MPGSLSLLLGVLDYDPSSEFCHLLHTYVPHLCEWMLIQPWLESLFVGFVLYMVGCMVLTIPIDFGLRSYIDGVIG